MITVAFYVKDDNSYQGFVVEGHANYADSGQDIVCAGVSILAQTGVVGLQHYLDNKVQVEIKDGFLRCILPASLDEESAEKAQVILTTIKMGLEATKASYPDYIRTVKRRWS